MEKPPDPLPENSTKTSLAALTSLILVGLVFFTLILSALGGWLGFQIGFDIASAMIAGMLLSAVILAILGWLEIKNSQGRVQGKFLSWTTLLVVGLGMAFFCLPRIENEDLSSDHNVRVNNLKRIGLALHTFHQRHGHFPRPADGFGNLSWRVHLLPFFERDRQEEDPVALYQRFRLEEPWDSPHNLRLVEEMPSIYSPRRDGVPPGHTCWQMLVGPGTLWTDRAPQAYGMGGVLWKRGSADMKDGPAATWLVAEAVVPVPWTKPADIDLVVVDAATALGHPASNRFIVLTGDGSIHVLGSDMPLAERRQHIDPGNGLPRRGE